MFQTPILPFKRPEYEMFYEPAEDSFLLLDAIEKDYEYIKQRRPVMAAEIGVGSGVAITFTAKLFPNCYCFGIDINPSACQATVKTAIANNTSVDVLCGDLASNLKKQRKCIDLLLFNPPYVVTEEAELGSYSVQAAWAGGQDGRQVIDKFIPMVKDLLSPKGLFYLLTLKENNLSDIKDRLGMLSHHVIYRAAGWEALSVTRFESRII